MRPARLLLLLAPVLAQCSRPAAPVEAGGSEPALDLARCVPGGWELASGGGGGTTLYGPEGPEALRPVVHLGRRPLLDLQGSEGRAELLRALGAELAQAFAGYDVIAGPRETMLDGRPAAEILVRLLEATPGGEVTRAARFIGVPVGDALWLLRLVGPPDGSLEPTFQRVLECLGLDA